MNKEAVIGLDKIYLHHSVYPNKTTMIDCSGHHNSSGRNGSGKTTLQKLIPIFYGEKVNRVVPPMGTKDPFVKYYLKSEASFIAFEYTNPLGKCCVVVHKKADHLFYRFLKGALIDYFYTETSKEFLKKGKLIHEYFKDLKAKGYSISPQISTTDDYRAIIQNDKELLRSRKKHHKTISLLELAREYSLPGFNSNMQLMHKLTYALQTRTSMFSGLEDMIVSTQFDFSAPEKPKHVDNKSLSDDLKSLHDFASYEEKIRIAIRKSSLRSQAEIEKLRLGRKLKEVHLLKKAELESKRLEVKELGAKYELSRRQNEETMDSLNEQLSKTRSERKSLDREIEAIHEKKSYWDDDCNIQYKINQYKQIDLLKEQCEEAEFHYRDLTEGISKEKSVFDEKKRNIKNSTTDKKRSLDDQKSEVWAVFDQYKEGFELKMADAGAKRDERLKSCRDAYQPKREKFLETKAKIELLIESPAETEEERVEYESAEQAKIEAEHLEENAQAALDDAGMQLSNKDKDYKYHERLLEDLRVKVDEARKNERKIHQQRFPDRDSLISFLRSEKSVWAETIGKVIDPELLHRKDLQPALDEMGDSLYGISLGLTKVSLPMHAANEETLSNLHKEAELVMEKTEERFEKKETELLKLREDLKELEKYRQKKEQLYKQARNQREVAQKKVEKIRQSNKESREKRRKLAKNERDELLKNISQLKTSYENDLADIEDESNTVIMELKALLETRRSEADESIADIESKKQGIEEEARIKIKELDEAFKKACEDKGLDEKVEQEVKKRFQQAKQRYIDAKNSVDEIQSYEHWVRSYLDKLPDYELKLNQLDQDIRSLKSKITEEKEAFSELKKQHQIKTSELNSFISELSLLIEDAEQLLSEVGHITEGDGKPDEGDIFKLVELLRSELKDYKKLTDETLRQVKESQYLIERRQESRIYEQWQHLFNQALAKSPYDEYEQSFLLNLPPLFEDLLDNHLPQIRQSTLEAIVAVSAQVDNYYRELKSISSEISIVSNRLSSRINTNQQIDALSDISIKLVSKVEEVGAWKEMESFHKAWSNYSAKNNRELPPEELGDALNDVVLALEYAHAKPDLKSMISLVVTLKENGNLKEVNSDKAMNDTSSNGLSLLAVIAIYIGMSRYLCPDPNVSLTWPVDELSTIDLENIASLFNMLDSANIRLFSAFPTKEHNILKHFDTIDELDFNKGAMTMTSDLPQLDKLTGKLMSVAEVENGR